MKSVIVIQGPTLPDKVSLLKEAWHPFPIIFSTWEGSDVGCYSDTDIVLYNSIPIDRGVGNLNLQRTSSLNGFLLAKHMGFERVVKWRYDFLPNNSTGLMGLFKGDCINFYAYYRHIAGYVVDYFMEGDIDDMINLYTFSDFNVEYAEAAFTNRLFELGLDKKANFICKQLQKDILDIYWGKHEYWMSTTSVIETFDNKI